MKAITFCGSGSPVPGSGTRAWVNARKSSELRTMNTAAAPPPCRSRRRRGGGTSQPCPRPAIGLASEVLGLPLAFEKRTVAFTGRPAKWAARESFAASGVAVKVPSQTVPLAWIARKPGCEPLIALTAVDDLLPQGHHEEPTLARVERATVLYDEDCGFCRWALAKLLAWDRSRAAAPRADPGPRGASGCWPACPRRSRGSPPGTSSAPTACFAQAARRSRRCWRCCLAGERLAGLAERAPGMLDRVYRWVAGHRTLLGKPVSIGARRRADAAVARRRVRPVR